ncbi:MAG TPA: serine/threonine-protein kinase [Gemmatimonadaceae bacterium]|nr:serine/threonine-protein kinase [Gemmatimonadaceae bacterium]
MPERYLGQTLGKYRIDAIIGSGGFAWVYRAWDPELEIPVALKILKPQYAGDPLFEQRFRREASTAARLRHPNIVKIYTVGREREAVYFAMDFLPQGLADRLNVMTTLPESMLIRMAIDVASALGFAHREGVIHRDIKTDNILFDDHGNAIVADFGIARAVSGYADQTGTNMVVGTPQYFSPEQARGQALDGRADLYSLGVTVFKASTGVLPFTGDDWYEIARQHVEEKPPRPRTINPTISKELEDIILQCLEKDPADRFESGEHMCEALLHLLQDRGETASFLTMVAPPVATLSGPRSSRRLRRRLRRIDRKWMVAGGIGMLFLAGFFSQLGGNDVVGTATRPDSAGGLVNGPLRDTAAPRRVLQIAAPPGADLTLNGAPLGRGPWRSDTLPPGRYQLVASVPASLNGCNTTVETRDVTLAERDSQLLRVNPRGCGLLSMAVEPANARWRIWDFAGTVDRQGGLPLRAPLLLPEGAYRVRISAPYCADYAHDTLRINSGRQARRLSVKLIC